MRNASRSFPTMLCALALSALPATHAVADRTPDAAFDADALWRGAQAGLDLTACPSFGETRLSTLDTLAPLSVPLLAGGEVDALDVDASCRGHIAAAPDYRVYLEYSSTDLQLSFTADEPEAASVMVVNRPDGRWACSPPTTGTSTLQLGAAATGQYDIWVGTVDPGTWLPGTLRIHSLADPAMSLPR